MKRIFQAIFAVMLTACAAAPTGTTGEGAAVTTTGARSSSVPTLSRSLPPPNRPSPRPSTAAKPSPRTNGVTVNGTVYSNQGLELYNATVSIQSLDPKQPFSFRVSAPKGVYTVQGVPPGIMAKVTAVLANYEPRTQMVTFSETEDGKPYRLDFKDAYGLPKL